MKLGEINFNSHKNHNPDCDIVEQKINMDAILTFGIYVSGSNKGEKFCEYYRGENFVVGSTLKSYSRYWSLSQIPQKYRAAWLNLEKIYIKKYKL